MSIYDVQMVPDQTAKEPKAVQKIFAVEDDTIGTLLKHLDVQIRSSKTKIIAITYRCKVDDHIKSDSRLS